VPPDNRIHIRQMMNRSKWPRDLLERLGVLPTYKAQPDGTWIVLCLWSPDDALRRAEAERELAPYFPVGTTLVSAQALDADAEIQFRRTLAADQARAEVPVHTACSFCSRSAPTVRVFGSSKGGSICSECAKDLVCTEPLGDCNFCDAPVAPRVVGGNASICSACLALAREISEA
jgi:hypothetical protein